MKAIGICAAVIMGVMPSLATAVTTSQPLATSVSMELINVRKIANEAPHSAFTDLVKWRGDFYCTFRESTGHVPADHSGDGKIRVLRSENGETWTSHSLIAREGFDLRDPKLSVTPDGRLMLLLGGSIYEKKKLLGRKPFVAFAGSDGVFGELNELKFDEQIISERPWLWRVTWHAGKAYGIVYSPAADGGTVLHLVSSSDGIRYSTITKYDIAGQPTEAAVLFLENGDMVAVFRRDGNPSTGMIGRAAPPYSDWQLTEMKVRIGGQAICLLPNGTIIMGTREYDPPVKTVVGTVSLDGAFTRHFIVPSGGDTSYPGFVLEGDTLWMSYYSSHEGKSAIYMARIRIDSPREDAE